MVKGAPQRRLLFNLLITNMLSMPISISRASLIKIRYWGLPRVSAAGRYLIPLQARAFGIFLSSKADAMRAHARYLGGGGIAFVVVVGHTIGLARVWRFFQPNMLGI